jgi:flagellar basal-body rod modification protein FlgD
MTAIASTTATPTATTARTQAATGGLDQAAFLRLMTAQLTTQDPFKAVDSSQMVAQMAQFSQVAGIAEMNASLASIAQMLGAGSGGDTANWIGRAMLVEGDTLMPLSDGSYRGEIRLDGDAEMLSWSLVDGNGQIVHSENAGPQAAGTIPLAWASDTATGPLRLVVNASADGATVPTALRSWTQVTAIQSPGDPATRQLVTPLGLFRPDAALRIG